MDITLRCAFSCEDETLQHVVVTDGEKLLNALFFLKKKKSRIEDVDDMTHISSLLNRLFTGNNRRFPLRREKSLLTVAVLSHSKDDVRPPFDFLNCTQKQRDTQTK